MAVGRHPSDEAARASGSARARGSVGAAFGVATIARPRDAGAPELPAQVRLSLIELSAPDPPQGSEPITWRLLTTHPVANTDAAWQIVDLVPGAMDYRTAVSAAQKGL